MAAEPAWCKKVKPSRIVYQATATEADFAHSSVMRVTEADTHNHPDSQRILRPKKKLG